MEMNAKMEQFSATNQNPMLSVAKDGTVLHANQAGEPLLLEWSVEVREKLPSTIGDIIQRVIYLNNPEKIEVNIGKKVYLVVFHPLPEQELVNLSGFDISNKKEIETRLREAHEQIQIQSEELNVTNEELRAQSAELHEAYELLHDSEKGFRALAENSPDLVARFDRQNHCLYANPAIMKFYDTPLIAKFYGWSASEFIDKTQLKLKIDPEMTKLSEKQRANVFALGKPEAIEFHYTSHQGKEYDFDTKIVPELVDGEITSVLVISRDVTERKNAEKALANIESARKKEIHHRIKNNLQVISSLLDLQAEKFKNRECIKNSEVLEAFRESQDRVISMALIHQELYEGEGYHTVNFSLYIKKLIENVFLTYRFGNNDISLNMDVEENISFSMDTAVPLGTIVNELVSNSFKHAFSGRDKGEIRIKLCREKFIEFESGDCKSTSFTLTISDNGVGIPELNIEDLDSLGIQLVTSLVDQLAGKLELKRNSGTEFTIRFTAT